MVLVLRVENGKATAQLAQQQILQKRLKNEVKYDIVVQQQDTIKLHHRSWTPVEDGAWQHSLERQQEMGKDVA